MDTIEVAKKKIPWTKRHAEINVAILLVLLAVIISTPVFDDLKSNIIIASVGLFIILIGLIINVIIRLQSEPAQYTTGLGVASSIIGYSLVLLVANEHIAYILPFAPAIIIASGIVTSIIPILSVVIGLTYIGFNNGVPWLVDSAMPITTLIILPLLISLIMQYGINKSSETIYERRPADYKKPSSEIVSLIDESEDLLRALGDGVLAIDNQEIVQYINPAAEKILGWARGDAINLQYQSVLKLSTSKGEKLLEGNEPIKDTLNTNQEARAKSLQLETKNGKKILIDMTVSPVGPSGSGIITIFRNVTKERAEEREQAEFVSTASHEMRTPVASIEGYLGLALNPNTAVIDDKARDFIAKAHESAQHLGRLFQDLLDVSKADDGRLTNNPQVTNVIEYVGEIIGGLQSQASAKGLNLIYRPIKNHSTKGERQLSQVIYGNLDKDHLRELVSSLTENAIKYTPSGEVVVDVTAADKSITITVTDSGIGIPAEDIPHLFQKFYRVDSTDTREIGGTGLGLYLAKRLAETLGGDLRVESTYKKGSTFMIDLPRIDAKKANDLLENQPANDEPVSTNNNTGQQNLSSLTTSAQQAAALVNGRKPPAVSSSRPVQQPVTPTTMSQQDNSVPDKQSPEPPVQLPQSHQQPQVATTTPSPQVNNQRPAPPPQQLSPQPPTSPTSEVAERPNTPLSSIEDRPEQYLEEQRSKRI